VTVNSILDPTITLFSVSDNVHYGVEALDQKPWKLQIFGATKTREASPTKADAAETLFPMGE